MKQKPTKPEEKSPEAFLKKALALTQCAPRADEAEIEAAIRAYGRALLRQQDLKNANT